ncbi:MAG: hypothetical protein JO362_04980 [Streptomycetaceae bacterium]|nr:hypothetical protein [Streptomycetaceae bacterium]
MATTDASPTAPATVTTAGHAPTFRANGCAPANPATYSPVSAAAVFAPVARFHSRAASVPAAASATPPNGRFRVHRATAYPPTSPPAATTEAGILAIRCHLHHLDTVRNSCPEAISAAFARLREMAAAHVAQRNACPRRTATDGKGRQRTARDGSGWRCVRRRDQRT